MDVDPNPGSSSPPPSNLPHPPSAPAASPRSDEKQTISLRALIVTQDASIIIGKGGANISEIREKSGARVNVSDTIPGNPERILTVSGQLDLVARAFGLIVRRINDEPFDVASVPGSRSVTIRFVIPNSRMGSVIGKGGGKIKEIQDASGARLQASEAMLPGSTDRLLSVSGVADAVHIAVYYVGTVLEQANERQPLPSTNSSYRPMGGNFQPATTSPNRSFVGIPVPYPPNVVAPGSTTQSIYIPAAMVGSIIGKGGAKINEIRQMSGSHIKIMDAGPNVNAERLVTITGQPMNVASGVQLLYERLDQEKLKQQAQAMSPTGP